VATAGVGDSPSREPRTGSGPWWSPARRAVVWLSCLAAVLPARAGGAPSAAEAPLRVASLNLTADELLVEMLPADRLVAVTRWADDPDMSNVAGRVPATAVRLPRADLERIIALRPDLVVVSEYTDADFLRLVEKSGLRYHRMSGLDTLPGIRTAILDLGRAVGTPGAASHLAARFDAVLAELARRLEGDPRPRVLYWADPHTAGAATAIGSLIEAAGASNVARELGLSGIVPLAGESAFAADPDVFLVTQGSGASVALRQHPLFSRTRAVREGHVVEMPNRLLVALSDRAADAAWWLASRLHPARVPEAAPPSKLP
jgi:iron complex transport system substrate-binding protein